MGMSGSELNDKKRETSLNMIDSMNQMLGYQNQIAPKQTEYTKGAYDIQTSLQPQKGEYAKELMKTMPTYQAVDFNHPMVQQTRDIMDSITAGNVYNTAAKEFDTSAKNREFGSSYQAARTANLENAFKQQYQQNALTALSTGQNISNNNIAQALNLMKFYAGDPIQAGVGIGFGSNPMSMLGYLTPGKSPLAEYYGQVASGIAQAGMSASMSDIRTKEDIEKITTVNGINLYSFKYKPEFISKYNLPTGYQIGVIAQEVENISDAVIENAEGFKFVNYNVIKEKLLWRQ